MKNSNNRDSQFWQQNNEPKELNTNELLNNTLHYTHYNPVEAGFGSHPEDWIYSSARDYAGEKGLLNIILLDNFQSKWTLKGFRQRTRQTGSKETGAYQIVAK